MESEEAQWLLKSVLGLIDQVYISNDQVNGRADFHTRHLHELQVEYCKRALLMDISH